MKQVKGIEEAAKILASRMHKVNLSCDGQEAYKGWLKTDEIRQAYGSIRQFLEGYIKDRQPKVMVINYGESNGSSLKNPKTMFFQVEQENTPATHVTNANDPYGVQGLNLAPESPESLKARLWSIGQELERTARERDKLELRNEQLREKNEELIETNREQRHKIADLEMDHKRELANINKPSFVDKILEDKELRDSILDAIGDREGAGLNGAALSDNGRYVVESMQSMPGLDQVLSQVTANATKMKFMQELVNLIQAQTTPPAQELDATANQ